MNAESHDLLMTLGFVMETINGSQGERRRRIAEAYSDAQDTVSVIALDDKGSHRPRILACFRRFDELKEANDPAATGWMLTALQERISEGDLLEWRGMAGIVDSAVSLLGARQRFN